MVKIIFAFLLFLLSAFCLLGQESQRDSLAENFVFPQEQIVLHADRDLYLTGDKVYFKAFCLTEKKLKSPLSSVLYLELFDVEKRVYVQQKYALENGAAHGSFVVPAELPTNRYFLRIYTSYQRNFPVEMYEQQTLTVINPREKGTSIEVKEMSESVYLSQSVPEPTRFDISLEKSKYSPREKVGFNLNLPEDFTQVSVTVRPIATDGRISQSHLSQKNYDNPTQPIKYLPEMRGLRVSGILQNTETKQPLTNEQCLLSVLGQETQIHATETNAKGEFNFHLQNLTEIQTVFIGTQKEKANSDLLIFNDFSSDFPKLYNEVFSLDSLKHTRVEDLFLQQQIMQKFPSPQTKVAYDSKKIERFSNLGKPDVIVFTEDFIDLKTTEEIFRDIVPTVSVRGKEGARTLTVYNPEYNQTLNDPLVLLDNVPVTDLEALLQVSPNKFERIEVISSNYLLGDYLFGGIICLFTGTDNFADFQWTNQSAFAEYRTLTTSVPFDQVTYQNTEKETKIPDFRSLLYWNPQVDTNSDLLQFYTSDYCTDYEIIVRGFNKEGVYGKGKAVFSVEKN